MYGATLILTLAVVGGLIAYIGDKIGMRIGRKKLTLFGLRPKHTSILVTIITGILIAASSIAALSIASQDVRTALFRMKEIQQQLADSRQQLESSVRRVRQMEDTLAQMVAERDRTAKELEEVQVEMARVSQEYDRAVEDLERARADVAVERERVGELEIRRADLEESIGYLLDEYAYLFDEYVRFTNQMRFGNVAFRADEIIHAAVFEAGGSLQTASDQLFEFLETADMLALRRGAQTDDDQDSALKISQQVFDFAVQSLHHHEGFYVLRAVSTNNTLVGEPVVTYLEIIPNDIVFYEGEIVAEIVVDLERTPDVDKQILHLLGQANEIAVSAGMITDEGAAVEVAGEEFLAAISRANELDNRVRFLARAAADTWAAAGPLRLIIEVSAAD